MKTSAIGCYKAKAFSLIELLIVVLILALLSGVAVLAISSRFSQSKVEQSAVHLASLIAAAQQKALLESTVIGLSLTKQHYAFAYWRGQHWHAYQTPSVFARHLWPKDLTITLDQHTLPDTINKPNIIFYPEGGNLSHNIELSAAGQYYQLQLKTNGKVKISVRHGD